MTLKHKAGQCSKYWLQENRRIKEVMKKEKGRKKARRGGNYLNGSKTFFVTTFGHKTLFISNFNFNTII